MRLRTLVAIGAIAFNVWRSYRGIKKGVRAGALTGLKRLEKVVG